MNQLLISIIFAWTLRNTVRDVTHQLAAYHIITERK